MWRGRFALGAVLPPVGMGIKVSVVIPTFNRGDKLRKTLDALLLSERLGVASLEIVVVDDGSRVPASVIVRSYEPEDGTTIRCIRQDNRGPAAARNNGFRNSSGDLIVFVDDDVIVGSDTIMRHLEAHRDNPGCVAFGQCWLNEESTTAELLRFMNRLSPDVSEEAGRAHSPKQVPIVASGQLSVERRMFDPIEGVYRDDLTTPAAEEFELSFRLNRTGVPILQIRNAIATHDQPVHLRSFCTQQFKHAVGIGELVRRYPEAAELAPVKWGVERHRRTTGRGLFAPRALVRRVLSSTLGRRTVLRFAEIADSLGAPDALRHTLFKVVVSAHYVAGLRDGLGRVW